MSPTPEQLRVATDALRADADVWDTESTEMSGLRVKVDNLSFTRLEAGLFQAVVSANNDLVDKLVTRADQASQRFTEIADTLRFCADTYDAEDAAFKHRIDNLW